ncbi:MAG: hypothetical protein A2089_06970 [Elusimicrobia bacterium GWD2_63_28]|nr:MAG: hypothetical protein A2089_06970 [Elusimicrobia bacterium GWD2_63_28]
MAPKKRTTVKFHSAVYSERGVKAAAEAYADFASVAVSRRGAYITAVITPAPGSPAELADEFSNCALFNSR